MIHGSRFLILPSRLGEVRGRSGEGRQTKRPIYRYITVDQHTQYHIRLGTAVKCAAAS